MILALGTAPSNTPKASYTVQCTQLVLVTLNFDNLFLKFNLKLHLPKSKFKLRFVEFASTSCQPSTGSSSHHLLLPDSALCAAMKLSCVLEIALVRRGTGWEASVRHTTASRLFPFSFLAVL